MLPRALTGGTLAGAGKVYSLASRCQLQSLLFYQVGFLSLVFYQVGSLITLAILTGVRSHPAPNATSRLHFDVIARTTVSPKMVLYACLLGTTSLTRAGLKGNVSSGPIYFCGSEDFAAVIQLFGHEGRDERQFANRLVVGLVPVVVRVYTSRSGG